MPGVRRRARVDRDRGPRHVVLLGGGRARVPPGLRRHGAVRDRAGRVGGGPGGPDRRRCSSTSTRPRSRWTSRWRWCSVRWRSRRCPTARSSSRCSPRRARRDDLRRAAGARHDARPRRRVLLEAADRPRRRRGRGRRPARRSGASCFTYLRTSQTVGAGVGRGPLRRSTSCSVDWTCSTTRPPVRSCGSRSRRSAAVARTPASTCPSRCCRPARAVWRRTAT